MSEIDVSKCEFYNNNYCSCYRDNYGDCYHKCTDEELKYCYYKQLQRSQNTIIVGLQIQIMLLANNNKLNKCLDEIEEFASRNISYMDTDSTTRAMEKILQLIKQAKEGE